MCVVRGGSRSDSPLFLFLFKVGGVDVRDKEALKKLFREYADENTTIWNLAAPLSVDTAIDPSVAEAVTVGGMANVLEAMSEVAALAPRTMPAPRHRDGLVSSRLEKKPHPGSHATK